MGGGDNTNSHGSAVSSTSTGCGAHVLTGGRRPSIGAGSSRLGVRRARGLSIRAVVGRSRHEPGEDRGGLGLHAGQDPAVDVEREARGGVAEALADDLDRHAGFQQQGRMGVADVVQADPRQPAAGDDALERRAQQLGMGERAVSSGEDEVVVVVAGAEQEPSSACLRRHACRARTTSSLTSMVRLPCEVFTSVSRVS